jgi:hypothetical protein
MFHGHLHVALQILVAVVAMALLVWSACVRVASVSGSHPEISTDESLFFPLWVSVCRSWMVTWCRS